LDIIFFFNEYMFKFDDGKGMRKPGTFHERGIPFIIDNYIFNKQKSVNTR